MTAPVASLIISTYNLPKHLELVCAAVLRQSFRDFEVVICDDGSGRDTREVIDVFRARSQMPVFHVWQENKGFRKCKILNEGLRKTSGQTLIFLDGDCVPHRDFVKDHVQNQEPGRYLAGRRMELGKKLSESLTPADIREGFFDRPRGRLVMSALFGDTTHLQRSLRVSLPWLRKKMRMQQVDDLKGCNYSVNRLDLISINGFDEKYEGYGREDTDIEIRLQNYGLKIKSLKGLALQFHVWHPRREFTVVNDQRLEDVKRTKRVRCENGLIQDRPIP
ncbi:MAG: glycosyltransferase family 2 protein [Bacteriovoracia bacterium]